MCAQHVLELSDVGRLDASAEVEVCAIDLAKRYYDFGLATSHETAGNARHRRPVAQPVGEVVDLSVNVAHEDTIVSLRLLVDQTYRRILDADAPCCEDEVVGRDL